MNIEPLYWLLLPPAVLLLISGYFVSGYAFDHKPYAFVVLLTAFLMELVGTGFAIAYASSFF